MVVFIEVRSIHLEKEIYKVYEVANKGWVSCRKIER